MLYMGKLRLSNTFIYLVLSNYIHTFHFMVLSLWCISDIAFQFLQMKFSSNPELSESIGVFFPTALACFYVIF